MKAQNKFHVDPSGGNCTDTSERRSDRQTWWK